MAENGENTTAVPPNSETNTVVETTEIMETLPVSEISQTNESNAMDIVSMALSNVTEASNLMTVVDSNVATEDVEEVETVQQFEQVEVVEQQVVHEIPISNDMVITSADGQIILPSNSTPAELSAVETLVGGALQQTVLSQPTQAAEPGQVAAVSTSTPVAMTLADANSGPVTVSVVESNPGVVSIAGGAQGISASSLLGSIATMIDSTEATINASSSPSVVGMKINTTTMAPTSGNIATRTVPANGNFASTSITQGVTAIDIGNNVMNVTNNVSNNNTGGATVATNTTTLGLNSIINNPAQSSSSLPSTITIKTPPGSNSVSQSLLNSILNNGDVQALLRRNPGQPITIVRVPEDSPGSGGKSVNKITVTTGTTAVKKPTLQAPMPALKTVMRISTPVNKPSQQVIKATNSASTNATKRKPGRPPKVKEPPPPVVVKSKKTRSGRVSRPPIHRVRDYKTIHIQEMGDGDDERDDFADYDGELLTQSQLDFPTYGGRPRSFKCDKCDKAYIGKGGLARHFKNNPSHGDPAELGITYDEDEEVPPTSEQVTPLHTPIIRRKRRGRPPLRSPNGDPDFHPNKRTPSKTSTKPTIDLTPQALDRRKQRIQELMKTIGDEDLMELALPRLSKAITVWEFLLMKVEESHSQKLPFQEILHQFESVHKHVKLFADECLERISSKEEPNQATVDRPAKNSQDTSDKMDNSEVPTEKPELDKSKPDDPLDRLGEGSSQDNQTTKCEKSCELPQADKKSEVMPVEGAMPEAKPKQSEAEDKSCATEPKTPVDSKSAVSEAGASSSQSQAISENKISESRTDDKQTDISGNMQNEDQTQKAADTAKPQLPANAEENSRPDTKTSKDFMDLDDELAMLLGMEAGRYNVKEWMTTKLPTMFRFAKNVSADLEDSPSEEEEILNDEEEPVAAKRQKMNEHVVERPMPPMQPISNSLMRHTGRSDVQIGVTRENNLPGKSHTSVTQTQPVPQHIFTSINKTSISNSDVGLKTVCGAGDAASTTTSAEQPVMQQVVQQVVQQVADSSQVVQHVEQTVQEPMEIAGQVIERAHEVIENQQEEGTEAVAYQTEEQGHSIVPEGSTIMQMEDGTFLVQKPDGTAMQIHCPEGMTIETIQALLSMDAGNILQPSE